jgi:type IV pilus assembly protein PilQ
MEHSPIPKIKRCRKVSARLSAQRKKKSVVIKNSIMSTLQHRNDVTCRIIYGYSYWPIAVASITIIALTGIAQANPARLTRIETPAMPTHIADTSANKIKTPQRQARKQLIGKAFVARSQPAPTITDERLPESLRTPPRIAQARLLYAGSTPILARPASELRPETKAPPRVLLAQAEAENKIGPENKPDKSEPAAPVELIPAVPAETAPVVVAPAAPVFATEIRRNEKGEPLVTNSFADTDIRQALADIALQTGVPIVADNTVQGLVTLDLNDVPLERALMMLLQSGGYSFAEMDGYYLAGLPDPTNPNFYLLSRTEVVQLKHVRPEVILSLLSVPYGRYLSSEGVTRVATARGGGDEDSFRRGLSSYGSSAGRSQRGGGEDIGLPAPTYKVAITAPPALIARIRADIARLDQLRPQVMLEAMVLEVSQDMFKDLGINFATRFLKFNTTGNGGNFQYSSIAGDELAQISALVQNGKARLRANPRVATGDGQTAEVEVGRENYFSIVSGSLNYAYNTLEVIRSGISLRITPRILDDSDEVLALVEPAVRDVTGRGPNGLPEITFRRAATNVRVKNGESIVIAGLLNEFDVNSNSKIPILGDLPLIGKIFRGSSTRKVKTETIIIITPRILVDEAIPDMVQSPVLQNDLAAHREGQVPVPFAFPPKNKK